jgi:ATP-dependent exoDNAse (exonuclease V) beta subunit
MDTLNTLYVGMTRPIEELHIITQKGNTDTKPKGLSDIFAQVIPDLEAQQFAYGERVKKAPKTTKLMVTTTPFTFNLKQATNVVAERPVQSTEVLFGNVLHEVMALVDVPQDLDHALSQSKAKERLGKKQYEQLFKITKAMLGHEQLAAYFDPANTPYKERDLFAANGELLRPDRFVITPENKVLLLDFKTGQHQDGHINQLEQYALCLTEQGLNVEQKLLVYCGKTLILKEV